MSVCEKDGLYAQLPVLNESVESVPLADSVESRVNYCAIQVVIPDHAATLHKGIESEIFYVYHSKNPLIIQKYKKSY